ncbi:37S ribosomal protein S9, mitochondrial [Lobosporangium transversale]|nr:37S ribosomal protein S9, mitochondrial [Lobosporangium transversale]
MLNHEMESGRSAELTPSNIECVYMKIGQAEAISLGIAKALLTHSPELKPTLRKAGCITRDMRVVERKKPGQYGARKKFQWVKR